MNEGPDHPRASHDADPIVAVPPAAGGADPVGLGNVRRDSDTFAAAGRQRSMLLRVLRGGYIVLVLTVTLLNIIKVGDRVNPAEPSIRLATSWWIPVAFTVTLCVLFVAADVLTPNKKLRTIGGVILGLVAGLLATLAFAFVIDLVATSWDFKDSEVVAAAKVIVGISLCYLGVSTVLQTQDDFRLSIPYVEFAKQIRGPQPMLLDSSALIDARIADVAVTGIIQAPLVIPACVLAELQQLADSQDRLKRARGRRGLDIAARLQREATLDVSVDETPVPGKAVDQILVELARRMPAIIVTSDIALARIAGFQSIPIININELANALKPAFVAGERLTLRLIRAGEQPGQAVGYLDDGTMVIAEDGASHIGEDAEMTVRSTLQTAAGRLIFARIDPSEPGDQAERRSEAPAPRDQPPPKPRRSPFPDKAPSPNPTRNPRRSPAP